MIALAFREQPEPDGTAALIVLDARTVASGFAVVRHAGEAAAAQHGACPCCRRPSGLVDALRRLALDHARGSVEFSHVVVAASETVWGEASRDPVVAARFALSPAPQPTPQPDRATAGGAAGRAARR